MPKVQFQKVDNPLLKSEHLPEYSAFYGENYQLYDIKYYEDELCIMEKLVVPEEINIQLGSEILITRKWVKTEPKEDNLLTYHTFVRKANLKDD